MNEWVTKIPLDFLINSIKWAGRTPESSIYKFLQIWDNMEVHRKGTNWGKWSTSCSSSPRWYGPRLVSEACGALANHPLPPQGLWEGSEGVLGQERAGTVSWGLRNQSQESGVKPALLWSKEITYHYEASPGPNLFFTSPGILLIILSQHLNVFMQNSFSLTRLH